MLAQSFESIKQLLEQSGFFYIITTNMQGTYSYVNQHYYRRFASIHGEILNQPYQITMHPDDTKVCEQVAAKCFENPGRSYPATIRKHDGKGSYIITQWEYKAMFENGSPSGVFCLGYDITDFMNDKFKLTYALDTIQKQKTVLDEITFNQSHLVRAPLANILGLAAILQNMEMDQNLRNICNMIIESSTQLDLVVRDIIEKAN